MKHTISKITAAFLALALALIVLPAVSNTALADTLIGKVTITGVTVPVVGQKASFGANISGAGFSRYSGASGSTNGVTWQDRRTNQMLTANSVFEADHTYRLTIYLRPNTGFTFGNATKYTHVTINNRDAQPVFMADGSVGFWFDYQPLSAVEYINVYYIDPPKIGRTPDYTFDFEPKLEAQSVPNSVIWRDETAGSQGVITASTRFQPRHIYSVSLDFTPRQNWFFTNNQALGLTFSNVNSAHAQTIFNDSTSVTVKYVFPVLPAGVGKIDVTGVDTPAIDAHPDMDVILNGEGANLANINTNGWKYGIRWLDMDGNPIDPSDVYKANIPYRIQVSLVPADGYVFFDGNGNLLADPTINGVRPEISGNEKNLILTYTFPAMLQPISGAAISDVDEPMVGKKPDYDVTVSGTGVVLDKTSVGYWKNGVKWTDLTTGEDMDPDEPFSYGHLYKITVSLNSGNGYTFLDAAGNVLASGAINGYAATSEKYDASNVGYAYPFPKTHIFPPDFNGFASFDIGLFRAYMGSVVTEANGLVQDPNNTDIWYYCANGQAQMQYTGLTDYDGEWFYIDRGILDTTKSGFVTYNGRQFVVAQGRLLKEYNGLIQDPANPSDWYFVAEGQVSNYTGLVLYDGQWFYVINGRFATEYTGDVVYDGATFYVVNGQLVV